MKKLVCACLVVVFLLVALATPSAHAEWNQEKTWSYKWKVSFAEIVREIKEVMEVRPIGDMYGSSYNLSDLWASGGMVQMLTIKYNRFENGVHKFSYTSGGYGKGKFGMTSSITSEEMKMPMKMKYYLKEADEEFFGKLDVIDAGMYYGVERQTIISKGSMDMVFSTEISVGGMEFAGSIDMKMNWDLDLTITYSPALPWIPDTVSINEYKEVIADYVGNISGYVKIVPTGIATQVMEPIEMTISETLSGSSYISANLESYNSKVTKPSPVLGAQWVGCSAAYCKARSGGTSPGGTSFSLSPLSTIESTSVGYFDDNERFYTALEHGSMAVPSPTDMPLMSTITATTDRMEIISESATETELSSFTANREAYFNKSSFETYGREPGAEKEDNWLWIIITAVGTVATAIVVSVALIARAGRRKRYPPYPYAPPPGASGAPLSPKQPPAYPPQPPYQPTPAPAAATAQVPSTKATQCPSCGSIGNVSATFKGKLRCPNCGSIHKIKTKKAE